MKFLIYCENRNILRYFDIYNLRLWNTLLVVQKNAALRYDVARSGGEFYYSVHPEVFNPEKEALLKFNCNELDCGLIARVLGSCKNSDEVRIALGTLIRHGKLCRGDMNANFARAILPLVGYKTTENALRIIFGRL